MESIAATLGTGSGIDITALVGQLVDAQFAAKTARLEARSEEVSAQITMISQLKSGISGFSSALSSLVTGGTLSAAVSSSNTGILTARALPGASVSNVSATLKVNALAANQTAYSSTAVADPAARFGAGTLTFTFGTATVADGEMTGFTPGSGATATVNIPAGTDSLSDIASAINAAGIGVTASIVTDTTGSRIALKGSSGAANAFTVAVAEDSGSPGLSALAVGVGATGTLIGQAAANAELELDGVPVQRASNRVTDLIPGVELNLQSVDTTRTVSLQASRQTANLRQAVSDVVTTFNEFKAVINEATDPQTGALRTDSAAKQLERSLAALSTTSLVPSMGTGAPRTLAEIGVRTNRDGTLTVDEAALSAALNDWPDVVEKMFSPGAGATDGGLAATLRSISLNATSTRFGLGASEARYSVLQGQISDDQDAAKAAAEAARERLTRQFGSMDARVAAYKSTLTFLEQQVDAWNAQR